MSRIARLSRPVRLSIVLAAVAAHRDAGADHVCLQVLGEDPTQPPLEEWRALAAARLTVV